jgi:hypothetical protein
VAPAAAAVQHAGGEQAAAAGPTARLRHLSLERKSGPYSGGRKHAVDLSVYRI